MDAFTNLELDCFDIDGLPNFVIADAFEHSETMSSKDPMRELVDADTRVGYGGYCIVS